MLLFWVACTFMYATALWSHLDAPGASYIGLVTARLGRPAMDVSHFLPSTGLPLPNIPIAPTNLTSTLILIEIPAPTPIPTSTHILVPNTIIFPASPLPTAHLRHKALPFCYDGLNDYLASAFGPATQTAAGTATNLIINGPGLTTRYLLVTSALAMALATHLVHSPACPAVICILGLVCLSWALFAMRRAAFKAAAARTRVSIWTLIFFRRITLTSLLKIFVHCPCSCSKNSNTRGVANPEDPLAAADTSSPPPPPSTSPFKKLATMGPALTKSGRLIGVSSIESFDPDTDTLPVARKQRNRGRKQVLAKINGIPAASGNNSPPRNDPPPKPVEMVSRVWTFEDGSTIEYIPSVSERCYNFPVPISSRRCSTGSTR